jgi:hypothetical protein
MDTKKTVAAEMDNNELGAALCELNRHTDTYEAFALAVRALFATPQPQRDELAEVRAAIERTARVVQALSAAYQAADGIRMRPTTRDPEVLSDQLRELQILLDRERELTEKGSK